MHQRGRKSASALSVVQVDGRPAPLEPPDYLTKDQREIFEEVVASVQPTHFVPSDRYLVAAYAQAAILVRDYSVSAGADLRNLVQFEKATKTLATLATKLRLAPQSRMDRMAGGRKTRGPAPWGPKVNRDDDEEE